MILPSAARSDSAEMVAKTDDLLVDLLGVLARLRSEGDTAAAVVRCTDRALTGVTRALLLVGLATATGDLGASLRALGACTAMGELGGDGLVHDRDVRLDAEHVIGELDRCRRPCRQAFLRVRVLMPSSSP